MKHTSTGQQTFARLGWIGFGVPDWHAFEHFNGSITEYYGLWAYCQDQAPRFTSVCQRWPTAADQLFGGTQPSFIRTSQGLITAGMITLSLGLIVAIVALALPLLVYLAAALACIAFILLIVGLPIFGRQSNNLSVSRGDFSYNKRYGFSLIIPTIVLEFLAILAFLAAGMLYRLFGYGNITSRTSPSSVSGGRRMLGPANVLVAPPYSSDPYQTGPRFFGTGELMAEPSRYPVLGGQGVTPGLLSDYLYHRAPQDYNQYPMQPPGTGALQQPSIARALFPELVPNVTPAYIRAEQPLGSANVRIGEPMVPSGLRVGEPMGPAFTPIINLTGQTIVGPIRRIS